MKYTVLNSKCSKKAILIHGLFATSGYWLEYLKHFKDYKLLIFDFDYFSDLNIQNYIDKVSFVINSEFDGKVDIVISHSFGTIIANGISESLFKYSFEICPVHSSKRVFRDDFIIEISNKLKNLNNSEEINNQLNLVDKKIQLQQQYLTPSKKRILFYPNHDKYFVYDCNSTYNIKYFNGDHFNIDESLNLIFKFT